MLLQFENPRDSILCGVGLLLRKIRLGEGLEPRGESKALRRRLGAERGGLVIRKFITAMAYLSLYSPFTHSKPASRKKGCVCWPAS